MPTTNEIPESTKLSPDAESMKKKLIERTDRFFESHGIRLKIRKLPLTMEDDNSTGGGNSEATSDQSLPMYHFVTRQKRHMTEQLLRNRCSYSTDYNKIDDEQNRLSPWILQPLTDMILDHVSKMSSDFDDPEFSGVWLSLHTHPFITDSDYGSLARSKIVGWALIEVLTTNERCLKALWIHPGLSATATSDLLRVFLPRVVCEAFELVAPQEEDSCPWKFFYTWLNDFDMLPRQTWLALTSQRFLGLPKHCDNLNETEGNALGHVDDGDPVGSSCPCQETATWDDWDQILVGCTEAYLYKNLDRVIKMIDGKHQNSARLQDDVQSLPNDSHNNDHSHLGPESVEDIRNAETYSFDTKELQVMVIALAIPFMVPTCQSIFLTLIDRQSLLKQIYGKWADGRLKGKERLQRDEDIANERRKNQSHQNLASNTSSSSTSSSSSQSSGQNNHSSSKDDGDTAPAHAGKRQKTN